MKSEGRKMKKTVLAVLLPVALGLGTSAVFGREVFVRKRTVPGFFMPENAIEQPKTIFPTPQYSEGQTETVKAISSDASNRKVLTTKEFLEMSAAGKNNAEKQKKADKPAPVAQTEEYARKETPARKTLAAQPAQPEEREELVIKDNNPEIPEYQKKYQEYLSALEYVAQGKKLPHDQVLEDDLSEMNSNARELIQKRKSEDESFNENRPQTEEMLNQQ